MFCLITSSKLSDLKFEFSLKVKVHLGDEIDSRLSSKTFPTLTSAKKVLKNLPPKERQRRRIYDERITVNTMISAASISYITP
jgi:hypothetical protein